MDTHTSRRTLRGRTRTPALREEILPKSGKFSDSPIGKTADTHAEERGGRTREERGHPYLGKKSYPNPQQNSACPIDFWLCPNGLAEPGGFGALAEKPV
jgi:hypothetical protein